MSLLLFAFYVDLQLWLVVILLSRRTLSLTHSIFGRDVELFADLLLGPFGLSSGRSLALLVLGRSLPGKS